MLETRNADVDQLGQVTEQAAALAQELAAAAECLRQQARRLVQVASARRLESTGSSRPAPELQGWRREAVGM